MKRTVIATLLAVIALPAPPASAGPADCAPAAVQLKPDRGSPGRRVKLAVGGATVGKPIYLHARDRRGKRWVRSWRLTRRAGSCGEVVFRGRWLRRLKTSLWRLHVSSKRRPSRTGPGWVDVSIQRKLVAPFRRYFIVVRRSRER